MAKSVKKPHDVAEALADAMYVAAFDVIFSGDYDDLTCAEARDKIGEIAAQMVAGHASATTR